MKILITNNALSTRTGSELYAKEVAEELKKKGHLVAAFSTDTGKLAEQMIEDGIEVVDDLNNLSWVPDVIHGQHHLETMIALAYFQNVPAIYVCHGWRPWQEKPPLHPRVIQYFAVDSNTFKFAIDQGGVPPEKIRLTHNFVNLDRFQERGVLPDRPRRALVFNNTASESNYLPVIRQACREENITLETIGFASGSQTDNPEKLLKNYDLVFAVGRSALEALVTGAAVVICGDLGVGPMVTSGELKELRDMNFGTAAIHSKLSVSAIHAEIVKYDAKDSSLVAKKMRALASIELAVAEIERYYVEAIERHKESGIDPGSEMRAFSAYLKETAIFLKRTFQDLHEKNLKILDIESSGVGKLMQVRRKIRKFFKV